MSQPPPARAVPPPAARLAAGAPAASDAELVERARGGDTAAFGRLVQRHLRAAHAVARAVVGERADAEDVCQDAFVHAHERLADCRPAAHFRRWLLASVRNRAISHRRWRQVRSAAVLGAAPGETDAPCPAPGPGVAAERADLRARLTAALATLPEAQRTVVVLHDVEGWRHREIAELLGVAHGTSRAMLFAARRRLRPLLAPLLAPPAGTRRPLRAAAPAIVAPAIVAPAIVAPFALEHIA